MSATDLDVADDDILHEVPARLAVRVVAAEAEAGAVLNRLRWGRERHVRLPLVPGSSAVRELMRTDRDSFNRFVRTLMTRAGGGGYHR